MQREIREVHPEAMGEGFERFRNLKKDGILLKPEQPGNVIARLTLSADKELSGKFLRYVIKRFEKNIFIKAMDSNTTIAGTTTSCWPSIRMSKRELFEGQRCFSQKVQENR